MAQANTAKSSLSLRVKFTIISATAVCVIIFAAVENYFMQHNIVGLANQAETASQLLANHMNGDMMHDALAADALRAELGLKTGNASEIAQAQQEAQDHGAALLKDLDDNLSLPGIPEQLRRTIAGQEDEIRDYVDLARRYTQAAGADLRTGAGQAARMDEALAKSFAALDAVQDATTEEIRKYTGNIRAHQVQIAQSANILAIVTAFLTLMLTLVFPVFSRISLFFPMEKLLKAMESLAGGNIEVEVPFTDRTNEIGKMAKTLLVFRENAEEKLYFAKQQEQERKNAEATRKRDMFGLADKFETGVKGVVDTVASAANEMDATSRSLMKQTDSSGQKLGELVQGIGTASHNVQTVASSAAELSASINEISTQVSRSSKITAGAVQEARRANATAEGLSEAAQKIGNVLNVINEIAGQINLLALNATIEAARAGEAGKGFAVVASEVKNLANQTTKATQEIEGQISMIQSTAADTVNVIQQISGTIDEINQISSSIAAAVEEQGMATQEIARNVQQAAEITEAISGTATEVKQSANDTGAAVSQMISAASELSRQSETLKNQVGTFLSGIKAA